MLLASYLPKFFDVQDAASFAHSVLPFYVAAAIKSPQYGSFLDVYTSTNPFVSGSFFSIVSSLSVFVISSYTGNWSWVDRLWGFLPMLYSLHYLTFAALHRLVSPRLLIMTGLQLLWGLRLSFNYWRKGGFQRGSEDYRWIYVRKLVTAYLPEGLKSIVKVVFNIIFISFIQNILLFLMTSPNYLVMLVGSDTPINYKDVLCVVGLLACIGIESLADQQQWTYQNAKHATPSKSTRSYSKQVPQASYTRPEDLRRGFITGGLFRYSRHPNFAAEQTIWYIVYAFGCVATRTLWNWTAVAPVALTTVIFVGSTILTEWITAQKYLEYRTYQKRVGKFLPLPGYVWRDDAKKSR